MRENGLRARQPRRFRRTADGRHAFPVAPNRLDQAFAAERPHRKGGADLSCIWTQEGWLYLAVVIDLFARRVVGWAVSDRPHRERALAALRRALAARWPAIGPIHPSDRGSQCCSIEHPAELPKPGLQIPRSGKGNGCDNSMVGRFSGTLKGEPVWRPRFQTRSEARETPARPIDGLYNPPRPHSALTSVSPAPCERQATRQTAPP